MIGAGTLLSACAMDPGCWFPIVPTVATKIDPGDKPHKKPHDPQTDQNDENKGPCADLNPPDTVISYLDRNWYREHICPRHNRNKRGNGAFSSDRYEDMQNLLGELQFLVRMGRGVWVEIGGQCEITLDLGHNIGKDESGRKTPCLTVITEPKPPYSVITRYPDHCE